MTLPDHCLQTGVIILGQLFHFLIPDLPLPADFVLQLVFLVLLIDGILIPQLSLPIECDAGVGLVVFVLLNDFGSIAVMVVVDLLAIRRPLIDMLYMLAFVHLLLHCGIVTAALLLMLCTLLEDLGDIFWPLIPKCPRFYRILRSCVLGARRRVLL